MPDKIALKRLGPSDLSFFEVHYAGRTYGVSNQKAINLNTEVFVDLFYPDAHRLLGARWPVVLTFFGPGEASAYSPDGDPRRPITYNNGKNWRLNGGTVHDDQRAPDRFAVLEPGDVALLRFRGDPAPEEVDVILVAAALESDAAAHAILDGMIPSGRRSMVALTPGQLNAALADVGLPTGHPLLDDSSDPELEVEIEDVARGSEPGPRLQRRRRRGRTVTRAEMERARELAGEIGHEGEKLVFNHLKELQAAGAIRLLQWTSLRDAAAPYDFTFEDVRTGATVELDAKSTRGRFGASLHLSASEALRAGSTRATYSLARVYLIDEDGARLRIAEDIGEFAKTLMGGLNLPDGVQVDSFRIDPSLLPWGDETEIDWPEDDADEDEG